MSEVYRSPLREFLEDRHKCLCKFPYYESDNENFWDMCWYDGPQSWFYKTNAQYFSNWNGKSKSETNYYFHTMDRDDDFDYFCVTRTNSKEIKLFNDNQLSYLGFMAKPFVHIVRFGSCDEFGFPECQSYEVAFKNIPKGFLPKEDLFKHPLNNEDNS